LRSDYRIVPGSVIQWPVEESGTDHALFQWLGVIFQPVLDDEAEKLFSASAGAEVFALQNASERFSHQSR
jgi:hypothetical protein